MSFVGGMLTSATRTLLGWMWTSSSAWRNPPLSLARSWFQVTVSERFVVTTACWRPTIVSLTRQVNVRVAFWPGAVRWVDSVGTVARVGPSGEP